jgi:uncharacterized Zn-binding protein involved in type VI secretion
MPTVSVNPPKTPVTAGSHGVAANTLPNVCKMPGPPAPFVPVPLPNIGKSDNSPQGYSTTVTIEGNAVAIQGASFNSLGDVASKGTGGGLVSANTEGPTKFAAPGSMDVKIEGKNVQLLGDQMLNNHGPGGSPPNAATMTGLGQAGLPPPPGACPKCGGSHDGFEDGKEVPDDTVIRRGIPADKCKDGAISKSAFDDAAMSCDVGSLRSPAETLAASPILAGGKTVEFTAGEAKAAFPGNTVVFRCLPENPGHCQVEGRKTEGQRKRFSAAISGRLA